jgi:hypothetical protein
LLGALLERWRSCPTKNTKPIWEDSTQNENIGNHRKVTKHGAGVEVQRWSSLGLVFVYGVYMVCIWFLYAWGSGLCGTQPGQRDPQLLSGSIPEMWSLDFTVTLLFASVNRTKTKIRNGWEDRQERERRCLMRNLLKKRDTHPDNLQAETAFFHEAFALHVYRIKRKTCVAIADELVTNSSPNEALFVPPNELGRILFFKERHEMCGNATVLS